MPKDCCSKNSKKGEEIKSLQGFLKTISDANRLRILCLLSEKELCVCEIFEALELTQNLVSHHLSRLKDHKLVQERKEKTFIYYSLNVKAIKNYKTLLNKIIT